MHKTSDINVVETKALPSPAHLLAELPKTEAQAAFITRARQEIHRIIFTNAGHPRKGIDTLLDAVALLRPEFPGIQVALAGAIGTRNGYGRYLRRRLEQLGSAAQYLGPLTAEQMAGELLQAHVFVSPSFIDNSSNAVCEAQLLGMPVVSSYTGGVPSLIDEGRTGLFFPPGDAPMLASRLRQLFEDDPLAALLGAQARQAALLRHDPGTIVGEVVATYREILGTTQEKG